MKSKMEERIMLMVENCLMLLNTMDVRGCLHTKKSSFGSHEMIFA
jgi:hypothetical protein